MLFAHDTEVALAAAAALVNTAQPGADELADVPSLSAFVQAWGWTGPRRGDQAELDEVRALRPRLRRLWRLDVDAFAGEVNAMLREASALPQLVTRALGGVDQRGRGRQGHLGVMSEEHLTPFTTPPSVSGA